MSLRLCTKSSQSLRPHLRLTHRIRFLSTPPPSSTQPQKDIEPTSASNQDEEMYEPSLRQRITTAVKETFDKQKNLERRAEIKKEMQQSYWKDFKELNQTGGKLYEAASRLLKEQRSIKFPQIKVTPLNQSEDINLIKKLEGKISLVSFCFVQYGEKHIQSFADPFRNEFSGVDGVQQIEINAQETWMKSAIVKMCLPQLRRQIPKDRQVHSLSAIDRYYF
ncbi:ATP10 protein-domain-containing protein [Paraphysoderma sedebokerense]|nr:ATP10 protein-domain-containing protein [Paraphysoderma sedebokerense]